MTLTAVLRYTMAMSFPPLEFRELPDPPHWRKAIGVGIVVMGLAIGTGELILWPSLVVNHGLSVLWMALVGILIQFVINHEVARLALATGESFFTSSARVLSWTPLLWMFAAVVLYIWPGWASALGTMLTALFGFGNYLAWAWAGLGLVLVLTFSGRAAYAGLERGLRVIVPTFFVLLVVMSFVNLTWADFGDGLRGLMSFGHIPRGIDTDTLLSAIVFSGAGGMLNLVIGLWYRDKRFGMGAYVESIQNPVTGHPVAISPLGATFHPGPETHHRWRGWLRYVRIDQGLIFLALGFTTLFLLSLNAHAVLVPRGLHPVGADIAVAQADIFGLKLGIIGTKIFLAMASLMLFSVLWTVIDAFARIVSDIIYTNSRVGRLAPLFRPVRTVSLHVLYYGLIIIIVLLGASLLPYKQPFALLVLSGVLGGLTMALYVPFLWYINARRLPRELRPGLITQCALAGATIFYWYFSWRLLS